MNFKNFVKNKFNLTFLCMTAVSVVLLLLSNLVPTMMPFSVILFGVSCVFGIPAVLWIKRARDNSQALNNIELTPQQSRQIEKMQKNTKFMYLGIILMLGVFAAMLIYTGITMIM